MFLHERKHESNCICILGSVWIFRALRKFHENTLYIFGVWYVICDRQALMVVWSHVPSKINESMELSVERWNLHAEAVKTYIQQKKKHSNNSDNLQANLNLKLFEWDYISWESSAEMSNEQMIVRFFSCFLSLFLFK